MSIKSSIVNKLAGAFGIIKHIKPGWSIDEARPHSLSNPHKLSSGDTFNYKIIKALPSGAAAAMFVVKDINNGLVPTVALEGAAALTPQYVVKRYKSYVPIRAVEREYNILRHLQRIKSLKHAIPTDPALIQTHNDSYLIYPYIEGTVATEYQEAILKMQSLECLKHYIYNIVRLAVACQTKANVSHLDIKPNNMIYCPIKKKLSLIDFGSARYLSQEDERKLIPIPHPIGTRYYAAPEILSRYFNNRSDTYCIGRILQYFVDRHMPIGADGDDLLGRMLVVDPMLRPSLTEVMHSPWFNEGYHDTSLPPLNTGGNALVLV